MNESFMKDTRKWLDNLKLRARWGVTGVIPGYPYSSMVRYTYSGGNYFRDGQWNKGLKAISNANPDLKWETTREFNVGVDWSVFDYAVPSPPNLYTSTLANVGKMTNKGIEVMVKAVPIRTKDLEWTTQVTLQHNKNELVSLSNDLYQTDNVLWLQGVGDPVSPHTRLR